MNEEAIWSNDVWASAEAFSAKCSDLIDEIQYTARPDVVAAINPSGRFQDAILRQLQHLSFLMQSAIKYQDTKNFRIQSNEFIEYAEANGFEVIEISSEFEHLEPLLEESKVELIFQSDTIILPNRQLLLASAEKLIEIVRREPKLIFEVSPRAFEEIVAEIFFKNGFEVELMQQTRDGGKDIIAIGTQMGIPTKYVIECKRYSPTRKVTLDIVQRLYGVKYALNAAVGLVVTTSTFTRDAMAFAHQHPWELSLKGYEALVEWIAKLSNSGFNRDRLFRYAPKPSR